MKTLIKQSRHQYSRAQGDAENLPLNLLSNPLSFVYLDVKLSLVIHRKNRCDLRPMSMLTKLFDGLFVEYTNGCSSFAKKILPFELFGNFACMKNYEPNFNNRLTIRQVGHNDNEN